MRGCRTAGMVAMLLTTMSVAARAQGAEERAAAREVVKKRGDAVVMVLSTLKLRINVDGTEQPTEQQIQANATILDGSGLAVMSLTALQPDDRYARQINLARPGAKVNVVSEPADLRMRLADGRELPSKLVLKDDDLDLAFVRPVEAPSTPLPFVDGGSAKPGLLDSLVIIQRTSEATGWMPAANFGTVTLIIDKPRTYSIVAGGLTSGAPLFDTAGKFVGVTLVRNTGARGTGSPGILPADDVREVARQVK